MTDIKVVSVDFALGESDTQYRDAALVSNIIVVPDVDDEIRLATIIY